MYTTLQDMEGKQYIPYINHIVETLRHLFLNQNKIANCNPVIEFCKNNFIFKLLEFLDFQFVELFLLDIFGVTNFCILSNYQIKFWKYLLTTKFFVELSRIMLYNDFS